MNLSKFFLILIALANLNLSAMRSHGFERIVADHPYLSALVAVSAGATVGIYAYKKFVQKPNLKKDDGEKKEVKSLFYNSLASLTQQASIKNLVIASAAAGVTAAAISYGMPTYEPMASRLPVRNDA